MANDFKHPSENSGQTKLPQPEKIPTKGDTSIFKTSEDKEFCLSSFGSKYFRLEQDFCVWVIILKEKNGINHINI